MTVYVITGTNADETIGTAGSSDSVTSTGPDNRATGTPDIIKAKGGDDIVSAGDGDDEVWLGSGNDTFDWGSVPGVGTGSDNVDGGSGLDTVNFKGFGGQFSLTADGSHAIFANEPFSVDLNRIETVNLRGGLGTDFIDIGDLSGTHVKKVNIDLSAPLGPGQGDGDPDFINLSATNGADAVSVKAAAEGIRVNGLAASVGIAHADAGLDYVNIHLGRGNDSADASKVGDAIGVGLFGGAGNDSMTGGKLGDDLYGGRGKDWLRGGAGEDNLMGGDFWSGPDNTADKLAGGGGADAFWLTLAKSAGGADTILDFEPGLDTIFLAFAELDAALGGTTFNGDLHFAVGKPGDADDVIIYHSGTGKLWFDADGSGDGKAELLGILDKNLALTGDDFTLPPLM
jgi:Ca2+-binding RTX toxin-like protein